MVSRQTFEIDRLFDSVISCVVKYRVLVTDMCCVAILDSIRYYITSLGWHFVVLLPRVEREIDLPVPVRNAFFHLHTDKRAQWLIGL